MGGTTAIGRSGTPTVRNRGQGGFTLIELLVVIAILAVLAGVAALAVGGIQADAELEACRVERKTARTAHQAAIASADGADTYLSFMDGTPRYVTGFSGSGTSLTVLLTATAPAGC